MPIVAMSAGDQVTDQRHCIEVGMNDYLGKPFAPRDMNRVLRRYLAHPVSRRVKKNRPGKTQGGEEMTADSTTAGLGK